MDKQYTNFLGGEVSKKLYHRADMGQFGRWFATAENLRFAETGSFKNRGGFEHIASTKSGIPNDPVKLLCFSFNDSQSFLIEMGSSNGVGYARFFKDGKPILVNNQPYEIVSPFGSMRNNHIRYAQAGDIIFITSEKSGLYELRRLKADGTQWEFKKWESATPPMGEINENEEDYLTATNYNISVANTKVINIPTATGSSFRGAAMYLNNVLRWSDNNTSFTAASLATALNGFFSGASINVTVTSSGIYNLTFTSPDFLATGISTIKIEFGTNSSSTTDSFTFTTRPATLNTAGFASIKRLTIKNGSVIIAGFVKEDKHHYDSGSLKTVTIEGDRTVTPSYTGAETHAEYMQKAAVALSNYIKSNLVNLAYSPHRNFYEWSVGTFGFSNSGPYYFEFMDVSYNPTGDQIVFTPHPKAYYWTDYNAPQYNGWGDREIVAWGRITIEYEYYNQMRTFATSVDVNSKAAYKVNASEDFFADMAIGDSFAVRQYLPAGVIYKNQTSSGQYSAYSDVVKGDGKYRYYSSGMWRGTIAIEYSLDKGATWITLHEIVSADTNAPGNDNSSGEIEFDDVVYFRVHYGVQDGTFTFTLETSPYQMWSYYKILAIESTHIAYAECTKNDVGPFTAMHEYKKNAFSASLGWPSVIGFFQNRMFLGRDFRLYGSSIDDFWDFYTHAQDPQDDDAVELSVLGNKVNTIKNLCTQKGLFVFTDGAEFGITSQGAITQADKFLRQFSSHGCNDCEVVLTGDLALFVDKTDHVVRALKYSFETESYESPDVTIMLTQKIDRETFIKADFAFNDKEAYFLTANGVVYCMKYMPEQDILSWSHWTHASGTINDICVVPNNGKNDIYIVVSSNNSQYIQRMDDNVYLDSFVRINNSEPTSQIQTSYTKNYLVTVITDNYDWFTLYPNENGIINLPRPLTKITFGLQYVSTASILTPTMQLEDGTFTTYNQNRPFKVMFFYNASYGFTVGEEGINEQMGIEWQDPYGYNIDEELYQSSGSQTVQIPARFGRDNRVVFQQRLPYAMDVYDIMIENDHGGK